MASSRPRFAWPTPQIYRPHSIAYGYFRSGRIEGRLTIGDREVHYDWAYARERM